MVFIYILNNDELSYPVELDNSKLLKTEHFPEYPAHNQRIYDPGWATLTYFNQHGRSRPSLE